MPMPKGFLLVQSICYQSQFVGQQFCKNYILSLGFTEEEYNAALEELSMEYGISYRASKGFPSNPTDGQEYVVTTKKFQFHH